MCGERVRRIRALRPVRLVGGDRGVVLLLVRSQGMFGSTRNRGIILRSEGPAAAEIGMYIRRGMRRGLGLRLGMLMRLGGHGGRSVGPVGLSFVSVTCEMR
ncbi:hypothetical protein B0H16DRAFT_1470591 [Mycena metata]|uniref:Uncharacterized protein n=1 Tax=Mycena metata TaxID=1033252 RepID=A0AAD7HVP1_9AGAR|nr:hypothetical protein B0H16DRAFT_1470591 [Mycena metata]